MGEVIAVGTAGSAAGQDGKARAKAIEAAMSKAVVDASEAGVSLATNPEQVRALMMEYRRRVKAGEGPMAVDAIRAFLNIA